MSEIDFGLEKPLSFYVASKTYHAPRWLTMRNCGMNIISTWIDEAVEGASPDYAGLALRCIKEASAADILILYCEPGDTLKGALIEVGAALASDREVRCVGNCESVSRVFRRHPNWRDFNSITEAVETPLIKL